MTNGDVVEFKPAYDLLNRLARATGGDETVILYAFIRAQGLEEALRAHLEQRLRATSLCPQFVYHPGETIKEYLKDWGWSSDDLADRIGCSRAVTKGICNGELPILASMAYVLENVFGRPAQFWRDLQQRYDEARVRQVSNPKGLPLCACGCGRPVGWHVRYRGSE